MYFLQSPKEAMPWVGLYVVAASLVCTLAMAADAFQGFQIRKFWFPCRFFTINAASITLIAIAMKLPVDLTTDDDLTIKMISVFFLFIMLANFQPSLGLMDDKELLTNMVAMGIFIITIIVNICIQVAPRLWTFLFLVMPLIIFPLLWPFSVALTVPASRRILELKYQELHRLDLNGQERKFFYEELIQDVKKHWMMAETGNPQFVIACSPICSATGFICLLILAFIMYLYTFANYLSYNYHGESDYKWSIRVIFITQSIGIVVGSIAPIFRCFTAFTSFSFSKKWSINHLNVFTVEKHCIQRLQYWKRIHVNSNIPGRHCKVVLHIVKNIILNFFIALQVMVVVICKIIGLIPSILVILFSSFCYFCNSLWKMFKGEPNASSSNVRLEIEEYTSYVLQVEEDVKLSKRILRNTINSITQLLRKSEEKEPSNLMKLLMKSTGFNGVGDFDDDQVPTLHPEQTLYCWSLVVVTLTAIAVALPNISNGHVKGLLGSMSEGIQYVRHIEESLNTNDDLVKRRKAAKRVWTEVEVYYKWLEIDLQKKARKGEKSQEILQWLGDEAVKIVIRFKRRKSMGHSLHKPIAASSMYRISQTLLLHCNEQENWPNDVELFECVSTMIADILCACFTNLPRVITMKCYDNALEKREESIQTAAQLLGKTKKVINTLQGRQLPSLGLDSMAYIDEWHALLKGQKPFDFASFSRMQPTSSRSNESLIVTIV